MEQDELISGIEQWKKITRTMTEVFGPDIINERSFGIERLKHYRELLRNSGGAQSPQSRLMASLVKAQVIKMEKQLFPSYMTRLFNRAFAQVSTPKALTASVRPQQQNPGFISDLEGKASITEKVDQINQLKKNTEQLRNGQPLITKNRVRNQVRIKR